jgi:hypothetical protein
MYRKTYLLMLVLIIMSFAMVAFSAFKTYAAELKYSLSSDRSGPMPLDGAVLHGTVYIFADPTDGEEIASVAFSINGVHEQTEMVIPFDLQGGDSDGSADPFNTLRLANGKNHIFTAVVTRVDSSVQNLLATVSILQLGLKPVNVTFQWDADVENEESTNWERLLFFDRTADGEYDYNNPFAILEQTYIDGSSDPTSHPTQVMYPEFEESTKYFVLRSAAGDLVSADSDEVSFTVNLTRPPIAELTAVINPETGMVDFSWTDTDERIKQWDLQASDTSGSGFASIATVLKENGPTTSIPINELFPTGAEATKYFIVYSTTQVGDITSHRSEPEVNLSLNTTPLDPITFTAEFNEADQSIDFAWATDDPRVVSWGIFASATTGAPYEKIADVTEAGGSHAIPIDTLFPAGEKTTQYFTMVAYDALGNFSPDAPEVAITLNRRPPSGVINFKIFLTANP